jgi:hypothetical protein
MLLFMNATNHDLEVIGSEDLGIKAPKARKAKAAQPVTMTVKESWGSQEYGVELRKGESIRLFGEYKNHVKGPKPFDLSFKVGDRAVYGSFNLTYTGIIVSIGEKTVTIREPYSHDSKCHRLQFSEFAWRNWDYDAEKIAKRNSEWMD